MKIILIILMSLMLLPLGLSVLYNPLPILGKVTGLTIPMVVQIKNLRTGITESVTTNEYDEFLVDWANSNDNGGTIVKYQQGDVFEVRVPICSSINCVKTAAYTGGGIRVDFDLTAENLPCLECEECEICTPFNEQTCLDNCLNYFDCNLCDCPTCPECEVCPDVTFGNVLSYILTLIGGLGAGAGVQYTITRNKAGNVSMKATKHKHEGIESYHSIYTIHKNKDIQHPKGCVKPIYENGKYVRCG